MSDDPVQPSTGADVLSGGLGRDTLSVGRGSNTSVPVFLSTPHSSPARTSATSSRTRPAAGNHEYLTPGAAGFFAWT